MAIFPRDREYDGDECSARQPDRAASPACIIVADIS